MPFLSALAAARPLTACRCVRRHHVIKDLASFESWRGRLMVVTRCRLGSQPRRTNGLSVCLSVCHSSGRMLHVSMTPAGRVVTSRCASTTNGSRLWLLEFCPCFAPQLTHSIAESRPTDRPTDRPLYRLSVRSRRHHHRSRRVESRSQLFLSFSPPPAFCRHIRNRRPDGRLWRVIRAALRPMVLVRREKRAEGVARERRPAGRTQPDRPTDLGACWPSRRRLFDVPSSPVGLTVLVDHAYTSRARPLGSLIYGRLVFLRRLDAFNPAVAAGVRRMLHRTLHFCQLR